MTDQLRQAAQQALEALERYQVKRQDFDRFADEITALKAALEQQQAEPVQENKTLIQWKKQGETIMKQADVGFWHKLWWADRPWRQR